MEYDDEELLEIMKRAEEKVGSIPSAAQLNQMDEFPSPNTYIRHFRRTPLGGWTDVKRVYENWKENGSLPDNTAKINWTEMNQRLQTGDIESPTDSR
jgi:hypothetical protein